MERILEYQLYRDVDVITRRILPSKFELANDESIDDACPDCQRRPRRTPCAPKITDLSVPVKFGAGFLVAYALKITDLDPLGLT